MPEFFEQLCANPKCRGVVFPNPRKSGLPKKFCCRRCRVRMNKSRYYHQGKGREAYAAYQKTQPVKDRARDYQRRKQGTQAKSDYVVKSGWFGLCAGDQLRSKFLLTRILNLMARIGLPLSRSQIDSALRSTHRKSGAQLHRLCNLGLVAALGGNSKKNRTYILSPQALFILEERARCEKATPAKQDTPPESLSE